MSNALPFFNWSLRKALATETDSFVRGRIRIIYTILIFSILKILVVIGFGWANAQWLQVIRAFVALAIYLALIKTVLYNPKTLHKVAHIMVSAGVLFVWTNIFIYSHNINLVSVQFIFMIMLSSFYILGNRYGIIYSMIAAIPVLSLIATGANSDIYLTNSRQQLASPGFEIIVALNFCSMIVSHYLFFTAININLREKAKLNAQLQESIAEAHQLAASRTNFLSTMSHELRTPLNSVIGIADLLLADKHDDHQQENLSILHHSALDLLSLINNVLDFNKADSEKVVLEKVPVNLPLLMADICAVLRIKAQNKDIKLLLDVDKDLASTTVQSDPTRLSQILYNLAGNAIKFTDHGNVTVRLSVVKREAARITVEFAVSDTGIGIPEDKHESIFEIFTQAESHTMRKHGGTGLGLAIVRQLLALFGSNISLESSMGAGSNFVFTIQFDTLAVAATEKTVKPVRNDDDLSHLRLLIAEDDSVNRIVLRKQLDKMNITPVMVENGKEAFDAVCSGSFDAILLDLHMPISDGYETIAQIRGLADAGKSGIYTLAFTASVTEQQKILASGFNDFLYKPVNLDDLREKLGKVSRRNKEILS